MELVEDYIAYHISHESYVPGRIFNTERIRRTYDGDNQYKKALKSLQKRTGLF